MGIFSRLNEIVFGSGFQTLELKKAYEVNRIGVNGRPQSPDVDRFALMNWQRRNELVYACIRKKAEAASDPEPIVERFNPKTKTYETVEGHPLISLIKNPNSIDTFDTFLTAWIGSEETTGDFYAEIVRNTAGQPIALYPLNPARIRVIPQGAEIVKYRYDTGAGGWVDLDAKDVLHRTRPNLFSRFYGQSPLRVAADSADADQSQTDFVRAFFHSDGIPSGVLKVKNRTFTQAEADAVQRQWMRKYSRGGTNYKEVALLDENSNYEKIGSNLKEVEADVVRMHNESRICAVFGVPPALIGAYVGLKLATNNATMKTHLTDFWVNTMSPLLKTIRAFLDKRLLPEFEPIDDIKQGKIRVNWDMSHVLALQEDDNARHNRARDNFSCGGWTLNQFLESTGQEPLAQGGNIRLIPNTVTVVNDEQLKAMEIAPLPEPAQPKQIGDGQTVDGEIVDEKSKNMDFLTAVELIRKTGFEQDAIRVDAKRHQEFLDLKNGETYTEIELLRFLAAPKLKELGFNVDKVGNDLDSQFTQTPIIESKKFEYEGLTLSREPNEIEKLLDLKSMVQTFDNQKSTLTKILTSLRDDLIAQSVDEVKNLPDKEMYSLTLTPPPQSYKKVKKTLLYAFMEGQDQVIGELDKQTSVDKKAFQLERKSTGDWLDEILTKLTDLTVSRIVNEIQTRAVSIFSTLSILGKSRDEIESEIEKELKDQSTNYVESFAGNAVNSAINQGRDAEGKDRADDVKYVEYSAILDVNTCPVCSEADGEQAQDVSELPDAPNPECEGSDRCRCFHVFVSI